MSEGPNGACPVRVSRRSEPAVPDAVAGVTGPGRSDGARSACQAAWGARGWGDHDAQLVAAGFHSFLITVGIVRGPCRHVGLALEALPGAHDVNSQPMEVAM